MRTFVLAVTFVSFPLIALAQTNNCALKPIVFPCSPSWIEIKSGKNGKPFVAVHSESKVTLFASRLAAKEPTAESSERALLDIIDKGISIHPSQIKIKDSQDFWGDSKYSKFEETKGAKTIFDARTQRAFHLHYSVFLYDGNRYIAGFIRLMFEGVGAAERYENWIGGGGAGDGELRELIFSITKEKIPTELPGGPPPAASMPLPGGPPPARRPKTN